MILQGNKHILALYVLYFDFWKSPWDGFDTNNDMGPQEKGWQGKDPLKNLSRNRNQLRIFKV